MGPGCPDLWLAWEARTRLLGLGGQVEVVAARCG